MSEAEHWSLDRFEGEWAVLTDAAGSTRNVPRGQLTEDAREGMLLVFDEALGRYRTDKEATAARQAEMKARVAALLARHGNS